MAQKTLINGTSYKISGGSALINGTKYQIRNGRTLINGTKHEIKFSDGLAWQIKELPNCGSYQKTIFNADFISNGSFFSSIMMQNLLKPYINYGNTMVYSNKSWTDQAYRTIEFDTQPTGDLLTWLQANATQL